MRWLAPFGLLLGVLVVGTAIFSGQSAVRAVAIASLLLGFTGLRRTHGQAKFDRTAVYQALSAEISRARRDETLVVIAIVSGGDESLEELLPVAVDNSRMYDICGYDRSRRELVVIAAVPDELAMKTLISRLAERHEKHRLQYASFPSSGEDAAKMMANLQTFASGKSADRMNG